MSSLFDEIMKATERGRALGVNFLEIRFQESYAKRFLIKNGEFSYEPGFTKGFSVRALADGGLCFYPSSNLSDIDKIVEECIKTAKAVGSNRKDPVKFAETAGYTKNEKIEAKKDHNSIDNDDKYKFLMEMDKEVRSESVIKNYTAGISEFEEKRWYVNSEGSKLYFEAPFTQYTASFTGEEKGEIQSRRTSKGSLGGYENLSFSDLASLTRSGVVDVKNLLQATNPPHGVHPGVLNPTMAYVLCHEAFGHMSEADGILRGGNPLEGKIGEKIASEVCTFIDDPSLKNGYGYYPFDDEGVITGPTLILEDGVLKNYLHNRESASKLGFELTGNARAKDFNYRPQCRMSNTFFKPGDFSEQELLEEIKDGIYAVDPKGGQVGNGTFHLGVQLFYEIKDGELGTLYRGGAISGSTLETLKEVSAVGNNFEYHIGGCGKGSPIQLIRTGDVGPSVACKKLTIGG